MSLRDDVAHHYRHQLGKAREVLEMDLGESGSILTYEYLDSPCAGAITVATAGLSEKLSPPTGNEILFACHKRFYDVEVARLLASVAKLLVQDAVRSGARLRAGTILGPAGALLASTKMEVLYGYPPVFHAEGLGRVEVANGEVRIWWLLPIHEAEATWARTHGYEEFVRRLERLDPDVLDLGRPAMDLMD